MSRGAESSSTWREESLGTRTGRINSPTPWPIGAADASAMENVKANQPKLKGTSVTLKLLDGLSYSDSFSRIDAALAAVEPFLKAHTATAQ